MDWFERLTGFREAGYDETRARLAVEDARLRSLVNSARYAIGRFETVSLDSLRERAKSGEGLSGRLKLRVVTGDVRQMHRLPAHAGALFQVASQFNCLEMASPAVTPERGVTCYQSDPTQGPACAIACGAATIYRNYFVPVAENQGQRADRQLDNLARIGALLCAALNTSVDALWKMQNGYALCTRDGLDRITRYLGADADRAGLLRGKLSVGVHSDIAATESSAADRHTVSQIFCSALPVNYSSVPVVHWTAFARLILEAAYEATMWAAVWNAQRGASNIVFLTFLGGGAFGNPEPWIYDALRRALQIVADRRIDARLVSYGTPSPAMLLLADEFG